MALTDEQRRKGREAAARNREAKRVAALIGSQPVAASGEGGPDVTATGEAEPALKINVKADAIPPQKLTLRERLGLGGGAKQATPTPAKRRNTARKADKPNLMVTLLPTILASLIATYARDRLPEEYAPCAPSNQEVQSIIGPLMDIIGRRVEVAAEISQDVLDITNSLICGFAYGARAYVTYVDIKKAKEAGSTYAEQKAAQHKAYRDKLDREAREYDAVIADEPNLAGGLRAYQATNNGVGNNPVGGDGRGRSESVNGAASNGAGNPDDDPELRKREADLIADMFKRDRQGRVGLGLLAG